jgi:hypothetical protein
MRARLEYDCRRSVTLAGDDEFLRCGDSTEESRGGVLVEGPLHRSSEERSACLDEDADP